MLDDCRHKISDLVLELGVFAGSAKDPTHAETLDHVRDRLNVALEHCETHEPDVLTLSTTVSSDLRTCAEKLSVEAVVLGEMAKLCRKESLMENPGDKMFEIIFMIAKHTTIYLFTFFSSLYAAYAMYCV